MTTPNIVSGDGPSPCEWLLLGEAPGSMEGRAGLPFIGPAGDVLWELAALTDLKREDVYVDNVWQEYRHGNPTPTQAEVRSQAERLSNLLETVNPFIVVLLGATAISAMLPGTALKSAHGIPRKVGNRIFVPMYHPAASLHNPILSATMEDDWRQLDSRIRDIAEKTHSATSYVVQDNIVSITNTRVLALDTETNPDGSLICISITTEDLDGALRTDVHIGGRVRYIYANVLVMHNAKFDLQVLRRAGIEVHYHTLVDTMLRAWTLGEDSLGLKGLAARYCNMEMVSLGDLLEKCQESWNRTWISLSSYEARNKTEAKQLDKWTLNPLSINPRTNLYQHMVEVSGPLPTVGVADLINLHEYAARDAIATYRLYRTQEPRLTQEISTTLAIEEGCVGVLADMEYTGVLLDRDWLHHHGLNLLNQQCEARDRLPRDLNPASGPQVSAWLYEHHVPKFFTKTLKPATHKQALASLGSPEANALLAWRHITDQLEVVDGLMDDCDNSRDGRVHTQFQQVRVHETDDEDAEGATATGRLSSRDPNLQNITPELRRAFVAKPDHKLVSVDYSQIEPRLMAFYARDTRMADGFRNGISPYITVGNEVFQEEISRDSEHYKLAKILVLGTNYRLTDWGFAQRSGLSIDEAGRIIRSYLDAFPGIESYMDECKEQLRRVGYVHTYHGRRRYLDLATDGDRAWRQAVNLPIQGTAAEIMKIAMAKAAEYPLLLQVHDELVAEVPEHLTMSVALGIMKAMESAWPDEIGDFVPIQCHATVGDNWAPESEDNPGGMKELVVS